MRRKLLSLFGLIPALAKAQQWRECVPDGRFNDKWGSAFICSDKNKPALNNQCPVCGTMAPPFHATVAHNSIHPHWQMPRCVRCNVAFFQDSEGPTK